MLDERRDCTAANPPDRQLRTVGGYSPGAVAIARKEGQPERWSRRAEGPVVPYEMGDHHDCYYNHPDHRCCRWKRGILHVAPHLSRTSIGSQQTPFTRSQELYNGCAVYFLSILVCVLQPLSMLLYKDSAQFFGLLHFYRVYSTFFTPLSDESMSVGHSRLCAGVQEVQPTMGAFHGGPPRMCTRTGKLLNPESRSLCYESID